MFVLSIILTDLIETRNTDVHVCFTYKSHNM